MHNRSPISLCKYLSRYPFRHSTKPISPFPLISPQISPPNFKNFHHFIPPKTLIPKTHFQSPQLVRHFSVETDKAIDEINLKFAEARDEIEMALESKETVYFNEEAECARAAVKEVLDMFEGLLAKLPENEKGVVQRSMGLKMEQLKAELAQLNE